MLDLTTPCTYLPNVPEKNGYVKVSRNGRRTTAHRQAYEDAYGPIPEGWTVDHECHNADASCPPGVCQHRACNNAQHLDTKLSGINTLAGGGPAAINFQKTECIEGHAFNELNTYIDINGKRQCRMCKFIHHQQQLFQKKLVEYGLKAG